MPITYPSACPTCGTKINDRSNFSRHRKYCGKKIERVPCIYCSATFIRKDDMARHVKKYHTEAARRKSVDHCTHEQEKIDTGKGEKTHTYEGDEPNPLFEPSQVAFDSQIEAILNLDNEGLDDPEQFNECYESTEDEGLEDVMHAEDEPWLLAGARRSEQQGANPLFSVIRERLGPTRRWRNGTVQQDRFRLRLKQNRSPNDDFLGEAIAQAFFENVRQHVQQQQLNPSQYKLQIKIHHNGGGTNAWTSSPLLPLGDWVNNLDRTRQWLDQLAKELNFSQDMDAQ